MWYVTKYCCLMFLPVIVAIFLLLSVTRILNVSIFNCQGHIQSFIWAHWCYWNVGFINTTIHSDTFKQTWVPDTAIHKVFNSTFLSGHLVWAPKQYTGVWKPLDMPLTVVNYCILRHCYPTQNLDIASNIHIFIVITIYD